MAYIKHPARVQQSATTGQDGRFSFDDVDPGLWQLGIYVPAGMELTNYAQNPFQVWIDENARLDLPFGLIDLSTATPTVTPTPSATAVPTATPTSRSWTVYLPLMLSEFTPEELP